MGSRNRHARRLAAVMAFGTCLANAGEAANDPPRIVYGDDDRMEVFAVSNPALLAGSDATAVMVDNALVTPAGDGSYDFDAYAFGTFEEYFDLCPGEAFGTQPTPGWCTGFKVGPDLIATAGHCVLDQAGCLDTTFVFGFDMLDAATPVTNVGGDDVYTCSEIVDRTDDIRDFAIVRVDRTIVGHPALPLRRSGSVELDGDDAGLFALGHPSGIPKKIIGGPTPIGATGLSGATVKGSAAEYFQTNLDVFVGSSGSAIVSLTAAGELHFVEGILVRGNDDFALAGSCWVVNVCSDTSGCAGEWEEVTRSATFESSVPPLCGNGQIDVGEACDSGPGCSAGCELTASGVGSLPGPGLAALALGLLTAGLLAAGRRLGARPGTTGR